MTCCMPCLPEMGCTVAEPDDPHYVRNFFSLDDLESATVELNEAHRAGSAILYHDGGAAVRRWCEAARSASS